MNKYGRSVIALVVLAGWAVSAYVCRHDSFWLWTSIVLCALWLFLAIQAWPPRPPRHSEEYEPAPKGSNAATLMATLERADFEAWAKRNPTRYPLAPLKNGVYPDLRTQCAWEGWQR